MAAASRGYSATVKTGSWGLGSLCDRLDLQHTGKTIQETEDKRYWPHSSDKRPRKTKSDRGLAQQS